jgi:hypothetical protein
MGAALRVVLNPGSVLVEVHDEWQVAGKRCLSETTPALVAGSLPGSSTE